MMEYILLIKLLAKDTMSEHENRFKFNLGSGEGIPEWLQWCICIAILGTLMYYSVRIPELKPSRNMESIAESILHGNIFSKSNALWNLQKARPDDAATLINILIGAIDDETPADPEITQKYHERNKNLAGPFADFYTPETITIGDLSAFSIRRIRQNLVIETSGDGGPTMTLAAVRKTILKKVVPMLCSKNNIVRIRILKDIMLGDTDTSAIETLLSCCLNDPSADIRAYSIALFITYVHVDKNRALAAVPRIIDLIDDPDTKVRKVAYEVLKIISGTDFGTNADSWKEWLAKEKRQNR